MEDFYSYVKIAQDLLEKDCSLEEFKLLTEIMTSLDTIMKENILSEKFLVDYERIHQKYGEYRWRNKI